MSDQLDALGRAISQSQFRQNRRLEAALARIDTTLPQWDLMRAIRQRPGASEHELAVATFQTDQSFGKLASHLLSQNMITRGPGFELSVEYKLTDAGERKLSEAKALIREAQAQLFASLNLSDRRDLQRILKLLLADQHETFGGSLSNFGYESTFGDPSSQEVNGRAHRPY